MSGWDDPSTARYYQAFERRHPRYRRANRALVAQAGMGPGLRVLDLAAGTGGTTAALLECLGPEGRVDCVEPSRAMREAGIERLGSDARVHWWSALDEPEGLFDRIVCGAALWQFDDLPALFLQLSRRLKPGGGLCFNIPGAYVGRPDRPGGGRDPWLTGLPARLLSRGAQPAGGASPPRALHSVDGVTAMLRQCGLQVRTWGHTQRFGQAALRDWMKIPVLNAYLWPDLDAEERARRIDAAYESLDAASWRREHWCGWTAWRSGYATAPLPETHPLRSDPRALRERAERDGCLLLPQLMPAAPLRALRRLVLAIARDMGQLDRRNHWQGGRAAALHELPHWIEMQHRVALTPEFQVLVSHPALTGLFRDLFCAEPVPGQGSVCRMAPPDDLVPATQPHRDIEFIRDRPDAWTAWLPLTDCSVEQGVLCIAPGSHRDESCAGWAASDMRVGDVLVFSARTLHRACPNRRPKGVRLSVDFRFMPASGRTDASTHADRRGRVTPGR
jgi:SAM-dependent methyltransferase